MPVEYAYDPAAGLVVVTLSDRPPLAEIALRFDALVADPSLPAAAPVLVIAHANDRPPPEREMPGIITQAARLGGRFGGRVAVVNATPGMATTAHLIALMAGPGDRFRAFADEASARRWALASPADDPRRRSDPG